jgi:hypothetical protein
VVAAFGGYHYTSTDDIGKNIPGVGVSDFINRNKKNARNQAVLHEGILVEHNEMLAYHKFTRKEIQHHIKKLRTRENPVLKELTISDHNFSCYVYDIDKPHLDTTTRDEGIALKKDIHREKVGNNLQFYHDFCYDQDINDITNSKHLIDIKTPKAREFCGLDAYYKHYRINFSKFLFQERRYVIVDPVLKEFTILCARTLNNVWWRMEYAYVHKLLPKQKGVRSTNPDHIHKSYFRWYELVYGSQIRRTRDYFLRLNEGIFRKIHATKDREQLQKLHNMLYRYYGGRLPDTLQICRSAKEDAKSMIRSIDRMIKQDYKRLNGDEFRHVRETYGIVTKPLLEISYPEFLRKIHRAK